MPLYQPTNIFPSSFAGVGGGVIDVTQPLTVSWQVNGSSALTYYQIQIYENTTASNLVYNSGQTAVNPPFFGVTSTGEVQYFTVPIQPTALSGLSNGFSSGYKMVITQWWNGGNIQQTSPSFFITRLSPTLSITPTPGTVTGRSATFTADYTQAQGDTLDWFRWMLATADDLDNPIEDSGNIFGTEDIQVTYDGLFTNTQYAVRCMIQTESGQQADTGWKPFNVTYTVSDLDGYVTACNSPLEGIVVQWPKISYIPGTADGTYNIAGWDLNLPAGSSITWNERNGDSLDISDPWTLGWSGVIPTGGTYPIWSASGDNHTLTFSISQKVITLALDENVLAQHEITGIVPSYSIRMVLTPREIHVYYPIATGGLFPSPTLYPSSTLYPMAVSFTWEAWTYPLTWVQPDIESITLHGQQICNWISVIGGEISASDLSSWLTDFSFEPSWDLNTWFLATFNGTGLNGGNITPGADAISGAAIYRLKTGDKKLTHIADVDIGTSIIVDEGFRNQNEYTYYVFVLGSSTYVSAPLISNAITPMFWNWTVLDCTEDSDGVYHLEAAHLFTNSVSTDSISNNNTPQMLQNFTPYPLRQPTSYNYNSSTLTGYIGIVDMTANQYLDTVDMAQALWALSISQSPKFLRDRKGNLWAIQTSAAITMQTGDVQAQQPYFGSLPWAEVASTDGVSIIATPSDDSWDSVTGHPPTTQTVAQIVVTAPSGATVAITNGEITYSQTCYGFFVYRPPVYGEWTANVRIGSLYDSKTVNVTEPLTYYIGLVPIDISASLIVSGPSGTFVTVTNGTLTYSGTIIYTPISNPVITDTQTGTSYEICTENGVLVLYTSYGGDAQSVVMKDLGTGINYRLMVENAILKIEETNQSEFDEVVLSDTQNQQKYELIIENAILSLLEQ